MTVTCYSSSEEKTIVYAQIRNQVAALQDLIRVCNRRHNDLNITARLPDDILSEIFLWNRSLQLSGNLRDTWFRVAFVCAEWRRVAINCATLWTRFSYEKCVEWLTQVIIPRSKNALLSVNMTLDFDPSCVTSWEGAHSLLRDHSGRVREMSLDFLAYSGWELIEVEGLLSRLQNPLPSLEILRVSVTGNAAEKPTISIPSNVHAPNLKRLTLVGDVKLVPSPRVTSLITTLTLKYGLWSVTSIVLVLQAFKKLQNLTLKSTGPKDSSSDLDDPFFDSPVVLQELKRFTLKETCKRCLSILSSISCPAATNIEIITHSRFSSAFKELGEKVAILIPTVKVLAIKFSPFYQESRKTVWLSLRGPRDIDNESWSPPVQTERKLSIQISSSDENLFSTLLPSFYLQELEILEISPGLSSNFLKEKFGSLPSLHTIVVLEDIYKRGTSAVAEALVPDGLSSHSPQSNSWYLGVRNARLNPRIVDVDAQNEELSIGESLLTTQKRFTRSYYLSPEHFPSDNHNSHILPSIEVSKEPFNQP
ncbi:hypothetical protein H0H93_005590 [Arthromyces matolae]|nr:hypothetical protein H0H93_005590 [Arthromyces matolae]